MDTREGWSNYWRQGHLTSLPCGFVANYDGEFLQFWNTQFALLKSGDCVLDVCSGNGSIALLAQDYSYRNALRVNIKAIDAADIDPAVLADKNPTLVRHIRAIEFIPNTLLEHATVKSASVDLVTSQYGIEYTNWKSSAEKIYQVLKPGGYFSLISHTFDSKIMKEMETQQRDYSRLLEVPIFSQDLEVQHARTFPQNFINQLEHALDTIYDMFKEDRASDIFSNVGRELEAIRHETLNDFDAGLKHFLRFEQGIKISFGTSSDLVVVSRRLQQSPEWAQVFIDKGLELVWSQDIHYHTGDKAGKAYQFRKPAKA